MAAPIWREYMLALINHRVIAKPEKIYNTYIRIKYVNEPKPEESTQDPTIQQPNGTVAQPAPAVEQTTQPAQSNNNRQNKT